MNNDVSSKIVSLFKEKDVFKDIGVEDDFFDHGVSSLTVVGLQIAIEKELEVSVSTAELMAATTINQWISLYSGKVSEASA